MFNINRVLVILLSIAMAGSVVHAEEDAGEVGDSAYYTQLKDKYELNEEQVQTLKDSGLSENETTRIAHLATNSDKTVEDIVKMRSEQKMGWGKIAKEVGVHPSALGKSVSEMKRMRNMDRRQERAEQQAEKHAAKLEKRQAKRIEKMEKRAEKAQGKKGN